MTGSTNARETVPYVLGIHAGLSSIGYALVRSMHIGRADPAGNYLSFEAAGTIPYTPTTAESVVSDRVVRALGSYAVSAVALSDYNTRVERALVKMFRGLGKPVTLWKPGTWRGKLDPAQHKQFLTLLLQRSTINPNTLEEKAWTAMGLALAYASTLNGDHRSRRV